MWFLYIHLHQREQCPVVQDIALAQSQWIPDLSLMIGVNRRRDGVILSSLRGRNANPDDTEVRASEYGNYLDLYNDHYPDPDPDQGDRHEDHLGDHDEAHEDPRGLEKVEGKRRRSVSAKNVEQNQFPNKSEKRESSNQIHINWDFIMLHNQ